MRQFATSLAAPHSAGRGARLPHGSAKFSQSKIRRQRRAKCWLQLRLRGSRSSSEDRVYSGAVRDSFPSRNPALRDLGGNDGEIVSDAADLRRSGMIRRSISESRNSAPMISTETGGVKTHPPKKSPQVTFIQTVIANRLRLLGSKNNDLRRFSIPVPG